MKKEQSEINVVVETVEDTVKVIEAGAEMMSKPIRRTLIKRFPIIAVLVIAFGVSATATAGQIMFMKVKFFVEHPLVLLIIGLTALIFMGKLHQKLG